MFMFVMIGYQIFNCDYCYIVLLSEFDVFWCVGYGVIVIGQFVQYVCWFKVSQGYEVDSGFGVVVVGQYVVWLCMQWEDVIWMVKIGRFCVVGDGCVDGGYVVGSGDVGGYIFGCFDGYGEVSVVGVGVVFYYYWQIQLFVVFFGQVQVYNVVVVMNGQCYLFNGYGFSGEDYIVFVFMVFIIKYYYVVVFVQGV